MDTEKTTITTISEKTKVPILFALSLLGLAVSVGMAWGRVLSVEQRTERIAVAYTGHITQSAIDKDKVFDLLTDINKRLGRIEGKLGIGD